MINERTEFALRSLQEGINFSQLCREYGISRRIGYKWQERFLSDGVAGMEDLSRRPQNSPNELSERVILRINKLHGRHPHWGPKKIREVYRRGHGDPPA